MAHVIDIVSLQLRAVITSHEPLRILSPILIVDCLILHKIIACVQTSPPLPIFS